MKVSDVYVGSLCSCRLDPLLTVGRVDCLSGFFCVFFLFFFSFAARGVGKFDESSKQPLIEPSNK